MAEELSKLRIKRGQQKAAFTRIQKFVRALPERIDDKMLFEIKVRLDKLHSINSKFDEIQTNIEFLVRDDSDEQNEEEEERIEFEEAYFRLSAEMQSLISSYEISDSHSIKSPEDDNAHKGRVKLPTINLPTFDGSYQNWVPFRDTFRSLIHNQRHLTNIEKFHYLKASLKGEAASLLDSLNISDSTYEIAFQNLIDRFENKKILIHHHVKSIVECVPVQKESLPELRRLIDEMKGNVATLEKLGVNTTSWDPFLLYLITTKLDDVTRREWESKTCAKDSSSVRELYEFINYRCHFLEKFNIKRQPSTSQTKRPGASIKSAPVKSFFSAKANKLCLNCKEEFHPLFSCPKFLELPIKTRQQLVKQWKICFNCLKSNHVAKVCISGGCKKCGGKHNTLLHLDTRPSDIGENSKTTSTILSAYSSNNNEILLSTAMVVVVDNKGAKYIARALLDSGSQSNFLSKEFSDKLSVPVRNIQQPVRGINQMSIEITKFVELEIQSRINQYKMHSNFLIIDKLTDRLPQNPINVKALQIPDNIILADTSFATPGKIDMIIGAPIFWELLCVGQVKINNAGIIIQKTRLGWIISGSILLNQKTQVSSSSYTFLSLEDRVEKFWTMEEVTTPSVSREAQAFEKYIQETLIRREDGKFEVGLPFNSKVNQLGDSFDNAKIRLLSLEKRLSKSPAMKEKYQEFIDEYEKLGHMTMVGENESEPRRVYYLPHHGVFKEDSITTKLRVVFDGSAETDTGLSLNDALIGGSQIQSDLFSILLRFRRHSIVVTSDIEKMYRQIYIKSTDRDMQRILWRNGPDEPIRKYRLNTVTYGTKSGSFLAIRCLQEVAKHLEEEFPEISRIINQDFYVDDLLTGGETVAEVSRLREILTNKLSEYGFNLRKWNSNHPAVVQEIRQRNSELKHLVIEDNVSKTLGLLWNACTDKWQYSVKSKPKKPFGKTMQELSRQQLVWDEPLPQELFTRWQDFQSNWEHLKHTEIPRHVLAKEATIINFHGFCDASQSAYGACVYLHSINGKGEQSVKLVCAKSRVAPLKTITLPRLELCGALLLSRLKEKMQEALTINFDTITLWTDSSIVLSWISKPPDHWKTFISNRVSEIQTKTENCDWRHVNGKDNPADIISRGMSADKLMESDLWWRGPSWLKLPRSEWPTSTVSEVPAHLLECKAKNITVNVVTMKSNEIFDRYSTFKKLHRVIAYMLSFIHNVKNKNNKRNGALERQELEEALFVIIKSVQHESFNEEVSSVKANKPLPRTSKILSLNPIIDERGILRVGGRIKNSQLNYDGKHQMLLPGSHKVTDLLIRREHHKQLHAGVQTLLGSLRLRFWIINGRNAIKRVLRNCVTCFRTKPKMFSHQMGDLPRDRVTPRFPFQVCGVDYAGPIEIKETKLRKARHMKAYICLFICFVTKATHMELATDLTTEAFINAFKRFIARRGKPTIIYSDNGRNFVGAHNQFIRIHKIAEFASQEEIEWKFIPPKSPHFGGLWEAAVKSAKGHLKRTIGLTVLTYEELYTLLAQIETCLNSRPLSPLSDDPNDLNPLTPAHFLIGRHPSSLPEPSFQAIATSRLTNFQVITKILQSFWARWSREYLSNLQQRSKWKTPQSTKPREGELVLVKEENLPPLQWRLGRITRLYPGDDGTVRVVELKINSGSIKRSIRQLCPLPID